jgi:hypothetical protein
MPEVELLQLHRMNIDGKVFERGARYAVDVPTAVEFASNPRFRVHGLDMNAIALARAQAAQSDRKPAGELLRAAIADAADLLDVDDDSNFDRLGKPSVAALSKALGYEITIEERDAAMGAARVNRLEPAEPKPVKGAVKIKPAAAPKAPTEAEAWECARNSGVPV